MTSLVPRSRDPIEELRERDELVIEFGDPPRPSRLRSLRARWNVGPLAFVRAREVGVAISSASLLAAAVVFTTWFRTGRFYALADLGPFVRNGLRSEISNTWTHQASGAGGPTYGIGRVVEILAIDLAHLLGGGDALAQRLLYAAIFAFAASGGAAFAARLTRRPLLVGGAGILAAFNPLVMINLPNFLVLVYIGLIGWFCALTMDAATQQRRSRARLFAVVSLAAAYLSANPPLLAVLLVSVLALPAMVPALTGSGRQGARRSLTFLARAAAWSIPLALWWVIPYAISVRAISAADAVGADTNVFSWSWTHAHGSLDRVLTLASNWAWPDETFGSRGSIVGGPSWLWLSFALPIALLAAPLVANEARKRAALWLVVVAFSLAFIAKGLNAPLAVLNAELYRHVPGMWLLREPMNKVGGLIALCAIGGWVLTLDGLTTPRRPGDRAAREMRRKKCAAIVLVGAPLIFVWPMFIGTVVRPADRVAVPTAWRSVARMVNDAPEPGKALVLPFDDFYQIPTTWGFYGSDTLAAQLFTRPTIAPNPQSYVKSSANFDAILRRVESDLVSGDRSAVPGELRVLGVSYVVLRKDIDYSSPIRRVNIARPAALAAGLASVGNLRRIGSTSVADVYETTVGNAPVAALSRTTSTPETDPDRLAALVTSQPADAAVAAAGQGAAPVVQGQSWYLDGSSSAHFAVPQAGTWTYERRDAGAPLREIRSDARGVVVHEPVAVKIGATPVGQRGDVLVAGLGRGVAVNVNGRLVDVTNDSYLRLPSKAHVQSYSAIGATAVRTWSPAKDCNRYDSLSPAQAGLHADQVATSDGGPAIRLRARQHSACSSAPVPGVSSADVVRVSLDARAISATSPRACLWLAGPRSCAALDWTTSRTGAWARMSALAHIPPNAGAVSIYVYADEPTSRSGASSEVWYRNVVVQRLVAGPVQTMEPSRVTSGSLSLAPGTSTVTTKVDIPSPTLGPISAVANCARSGERSLRDLGISAQALHSGTAKGVRLRADDDGACVTMPLVGFHSGVTYEVEFHADVERGGGAPRFCIWQSGSQECAPFTLISTDADGALQYRGRAASPATKLYLYADATHGPSTIAYRDVRIRSVADESLVLQPVSARRVAPKLDVLSSGSDAYRVHVTGASGPFILALNESYSSGWKLSGLPSAATTRHFEADGYRNAWAVDADGSFDMTLAYAPAGLSRVARQISILTGFALIASALAAPAVSRRWRRRRVRRAHREQMRRAGPRRIAIPESWGDPSV